MAALLGLALLGALQHGGQKCHALCGMDGSTGTCHSNFCGDGSCCKKGLVQAPCDGAVGCRDIQCCTHVASTPRRSEPRPDVRREPVSPPPPPPPPPPLPLGSALARSSAAEDHCDEATLVWVKEQIVQVGDFDSSRAAVGVMPWLAELRVVLLIRSSTYIEVMEVDGARLEAREQTGPYLRLTFRLDDEPAVDCDTVRAACFGFSTVGDLDPPASIACSMPAEFVDPPPSPPPRYISKGELAAHGLLHVAPPPSTSLPAVRADRPADGASAPDPAARVGTDDVPRGPGWALPLLVLLLVIGPIVAAWLTGGPSLAQRSPAAGAAVDALSVALGAAVDSVARFCAALAYPGRARHADMRALPTNDDDDYGAGGGASAGGRFGGPAELGEGAAAPIRATSRLATAPSGCTGVAEAIDRSLVVGDTAAADAWADAGPGEGDGGAAEAQGAEEKGEDGQVC